MKFFRIILLAILLQSCNDPEEEHSEAERDFSRSSRSAAPDSMASDLEQGSENATLRHSLKEEIFLEYQAGIVSRNDLTIWLKNLPNDSSAREAWKELVPSLNAEDAQYFFDHLRGSGPAGLQHDILPLLLAQSGFLDDSLPSKILDSLSEGGLKTSVIRGLFFLPPEKLFLQKDLLAKIDLETNFNFDNFRFTNSLKQLDALDLESMLGGVPRGNLRTIVGGELATKISLDADSVETLSSALNRVPELGNTAKKKAFVSFLESQPKSQVKAATHSRQVKPKSLMDN